MSQIKNIWEKYENLGIIGSGAFSDVYRAKYNNQFFAIKKIKKIILKRNRSYEKNGV